MPYYKRYKKYPGAKYYSYKKRKRPMFGRADKTAYSMAKKALNLLNVEYKVVTSGISSTPNDSTGTFTLLNGLVRGNDSSNRTGRQVKFTSIQLYLNFLKASAATNTRVRWAVVLDKQANEAAPLIGEIYSFSIEGFRNLNNRRRFVILKTGTKVLNSDYPEKVNQTYCKTSFRTIYDDSDSGGVADITTNSLYLLLVSDESINLPTVSGRIRLRFIDN